MVKKPGGDTYTVLHSKKVLRQRDSVCEGPGTGKLSSLCSLSPPQAHAPFWTLCLQDVTPSPPKILGKGLTILPVCQKPICV